MKLKNLKGDLILDTKSGQLKYETRNRFLNENEVIMIPIPGCKVNILPHGQSLELIQKILSEEGINYNSFKIKELGISLQGSLRQTPFTVHNFTYNINEEYYYVDLHFYLDKGMYATIVLREFMKCNPLHFT